MVPLTERGLQTAIITNEYSITIELSIFEEKMITLSMTINRLEVGKMIYVSKLFEELCSNNVHDTLIKAKKFYKKKYKY